MALPARFNAIVQQAHLQFLHGEVVFMPGEALEAVYLVERGGVVVLTPSDDIIQAVLGPLRIVGMRDLLSGGVWQGVGFVQGPTLLRVLEARTILAALACAPEAHRKLLHELAT